MKQNLLLLLLPVFALSTMGCKKFFEAPEEKIEGDWSLADVSHSQFLGWDNINSPYTDGIFHFDENGAARFTTTTDTLNGQWSMHRERSGHYNEDGNWVTDYHLMMQNLPGRFSDQPGIRYLFRQFCFSAI